MLEQTFGALEGDPTKYTNRFFAPGQGYNESYRLKSDAISIFGQLDWEIADRLTLTGGVNYTRDKKRFANNTIANDVSKPSSEKSSKKMPPMPRASLRCFRKK